MPTSSPIMVLLFLAAGFLPLASPQWQPCSFDDSSAVACSGWSTSVAYEEDSVATRSTFNFRGWEHGQDSTPTGWTGPQGGGSDGLPGYLFMEASGNARAGDAALLTSDEASAPSQSGCRVSLYFHMYGSHLGVNPNDVGGGADPNCDRGVPQGTEVFSMASGLRYRRVHQRPLNSARAVVFSVKASKSARVAFLTDTPTEAAAGCLEAACGANMPVYEIVLGGDQNRVFKIRRLFEGPDLATAEDTSDTLSSVEARNFWADARQGLVRIGRGTVIGADLALEWQDPDPLAVRSVAFRQKAGGGAEWTASIDSDKWSYCCANNCGGCSYAADCSTLGGPLCCHGEITNHFHRSCGLFPPPCIRDVHMFGANGGPSSLLNMPETSQEGTLEIRAAPRDDSAGGGGTFQRIDGTLRSGQQQNGSSEPWESLSTEVPPGTTRIQIKAVRGFGGRSDIAVDSISFQGCDQAPSDGSQAATSTTLRVGVPDDHDFCEKKCRDLGYCCASFEGGGSNTLLSCTQACMIRQRARIAGTHVPAEDCYAEAVRQHSASITTFVGADGDNGSSDDGSSDDGSSSSSSSTTTSDGPTTTPMGARKLTKPSGCFIHRVNSNKARVFYNIRGRGKRQELEDEPVRYPAMTAASCRKHCEAAASVADCARTIGGWNYDVCQTCSDLTPACPHGVQGIQECYAGCDIVHGGLLVEYFSRTPASGCSFTDSFELAELLPIVAETYQPPAAATTLDGSGAGSSSRRRFVMLGLDLKYVTSAQAATADEAWPVRCVTASGKRAMAGVYGPSEDVWSPTNIILVEPSHYGCRILNFAAAKTHCEAHGLRLPTAGEVAAHVTEGSGCGFDSQKIWTSTPADATIISVAVDEARSGTVHRFTNTVASGRFEARFSGSIYVAETALYGLESSSDDGSRVWVDGNLIVHNPGCHALRAVMQTVRLGQGWHTIRVDYFNTEPCATCVGALSVSLFVAYASISTPRIVSHPASLGLKAAFHEHADSCMLNPTLFPEFATQTVGSLNFERVGATENWMGIPEPLKVTFAAEFSGWLLAYVAGEYEFYLASDDGSRLWVDGSLTVDGEGCQPEQLSQQGKATLSAGWHQVRVEYFNRHQHRALLLKYLPPGESSLRLVPATVLRQAPSTQVQAQDLLGGLIRYRQGGCLTGLVPGDNPTAPMQLKTCELDTYSWTAVFSRVGDVVTLDVGSDSCNGHFAASKRRIVRRSCPSCIDPFRTIYYRRDGGSSSSSSSSSSATTSASWDLHQTMVADWLYGPDLDPSDSSGRLYKTLDDAAIEENPILFCDAAQQWTHDTQSRQIKLRFGLCMQASEPLLDGGIVELKPCGSSGGDANQYWTRDPIGGSLKVQGGLCLGGESYGSGAGINMVPCDDNTPAWELDAFSGRLRLKRTSVCVQAGALNMEGASLRLWPCDDTNCVVYPSSATLSTTSTAPTISFEVETSSDARLSQQWEYDGETGLVVDHSGSCLEAIASWYHSDVLLRTCDESRATQKWDYDPSTGHLKQKNGDFCLDSYDGGQSGKVHMWHCEDWNENQRWDVDLSGAKRTASTSSLADCIEGQYRFSQSTCVSCPVGRFGMNTRELSPLCSGPCLGGFDGSLPTDATAGHTDEQCRGPCPEGFYCPEGYSQPPVPCSEPAWILAFTNNASLGGIDIGRENFDDLFAASRHRIFKRVCDDCADSHRIIFYRRYSTMPPGFSAYHMATERFSAVANSMTAGDFGLFSTYTDAVASTRPWKFCTYEDEESGRAFPSECGPENRTKFQWFSTVDILNSRQSIAFYVEPSDVVGGQGIAGQSTRFFCPSKSERPLVVPSDSYAFPEPELEAEFLTLPGNGVGMVSDDPSIASGKVANGWCASWNHPQTTPDDQTAWTGLTEKECWDECNRKVEANNWVCNQAVYESNTWNGKAGSCWLGKNIMTSPPNPSRPGPCPDGRPCENKCYGKFDGGVGGVWGQDQTSCEPPSARLAVRCIKFDGEKAKKDDMGGECYDLKTLEEARAICASFGLRLPTADEVLDGKGKYAGCTFDTRRIWTSTIGRCQTELNIHMPHATRVAEPGYYVVAGRRFPCPIGYLCAGGSHPPAPCFDAGSYCSDGVSAVVVNPGYYSVSSCIIKEDAAAASAGLIPIRDTQKNVDYPGNDIAPCGYDGCLLPSNATESDCADLCALSRGCTLYTFAAATCSGRPEAMCWTKGAVGARVAPSVCRDSKVVGRRHESAADGTGFLNLLTDERFVHLVHHTDIGDADSLVESMSTSSVFECATLCSTRADCGAVTYDAAELNSCRMHCFWSQQRRSFGRTAILVSEGVRDCQPAIRKSCSAQCRSKGFCCNDPWQGAGRVVSCIQACLIVGKTADPPFCESLCEEKRCRTNVHARVGHSFVHCSFCSDMDLGSGGTCTKIPSRADCTAGCGISLADAVVLPASSSSSSLMVASAEYGFHRKECTSAGQARCGPGWVCNRGRRSGCPDASHFASGTGTEGACTRVRDGYRTIPVSAALTHRTGEETCPMGHYCQLGIALPCPAGTYGMVRGLASPTCSGNCEPNQLCEEGTIHPNSRDCPEGMFCPSDCGERQRCESPSAYCPQNSVLPTPVREGYVSIPISGLRIAETRCPPGHSCRGGIATYCEPPAKFADWGQTTCSATQKGFYTRRVDWSNQGGFADWESLTLTFGRDGINASWLAPHAPAASQLPPVDPNLLRESEEECPKGSFCPGDGERYSCPLGYVGHKVGLSNAACSTPCPPGKYGIKAGATNVKAHCKLCNIGFYCPRGSTSPRQQPCTLNNDILNIYDDAAALQAIVNTTDPIYFCNHIWDSRVRFVRDGRYTTPEDAAPWHRTNQVLCPPGYYCKRGRRYPCGGIGVFCPAGSSATKQIPAGSYSGPLTAPRIHRHTKYPCPRGFYCVNGARTWCGGPEVYCPSASSTPLTIRPGSYGLYFGAIPRNAIQAAKQTSTKLCPKGRYCVEGTSRPCPAGRYGATAGLDSELCSGSCEAGYLCRNESSSARDTDCGGPQWYCPEGSSSHVAVRQGYYSAGLPGDDSGLRAVEELACEEGYFCPGPGDGRKYPCGFELDVPSSVYCPMGSATPLKVETGYYSLGGASTSLRSSQQLCQRGEYCLHGIATLCPAGRYGATSGLTHPNCTGPCQAGFVCRKGSTSADATSSVCQAGYYCSTGSSTTEAPCGSADVYCPRGSASPVPVPDGHYSLPLDQDPANRWSSQRCESGYRCIGGLRKACGGPEFFCKDGQRSPVQAGYYSLGGTSSETRTDQRLCEKGYYCQNAVRYECPEGSYGASTGLTHPSCSGLCDAGKFGNAGGQRDSSCVGSCSAGYSCPPGSTSPKQDDCSANGGATAFCPEGSSQPSPVRAGYYATPLGCTTRCTGQEQRTEKGLFVYRGHRHACPADLDGRGIKEGAAPPLVVLPSLDWPTEVLQDSEVRFRLQDTQQQPSNVNATAATTTATASLLEVSSQGQLETKAAVQFADTPGNSGILDVVIEIMSSGSTNVDVCTVRIRIWDTNQAPTFAGTEPIQFTVAENSPPGTLIGTLVATDGDLDQTLTYSAHSQPTEFGGLEPFSIGAIDGTIRVLESAPFDYEVRHHLNFVMRVDDNAPGGENLNTTVRVRVNIEDTDDLNLQLVSARAGSGGLAVSSPAALNGQGNDVIRLEGSGFDQVRMIQVTYGNAAFSFTAVDCAIVTKAEAIECRTVAGVGENHQIRVEIITAAGKSLTAHPTAQLGYAPPFIINVVGAGELATTGGSVVELEGVQFGPPGLGSLQLQYESETRDGVWTVPCEVLPSSFKSHQAHKQIARCTTGAGAGGRLRFIPIDGSGRKGSPTPYGPGYLPPVITNISPTVGPTDGGTVIEVRGRDFPLTSNLLVGGIRAEITRMTSNLIVAIVPAQHNIPEQLTTNQSSSTQQLGRRRRRQLQSGTQPVVMGLGVQIEGSGSRSNVNITFTFEPAEVFSVEVLGPSDSSDALSAIASDIITGSGEGSSLPIRKLVSSTAGGAILKIMGQNLGGEECGGATRWETYFEDLQQQLSTYNTNANSTFASVQQGASGSLTNISTNSGEWLQSQTTVVKDISRCRVEVGDAVCKPMVFGHKEIRCSIPAGTGSINYVKVFGGGSFQGSDVVRLMPETPGAFLKMAVAYDPPTVNSVTPSTGTLNGGTIITIMGSNFGPRSLINDDKNVRVDFVSSTTYLGRDCRWVAAGMGRPPTFSGSTSKRQACPCVVNPLSRTQSSVQCTSVPGIGPNHQVVVSVADQWSWQDGPGQAQFSYDPPRVRGVQPSVLRGRNTTDNPVAFELFGDNFGVEASPVHVELGGASCIGAIWQMRQTFDEINGGLIEPDAYLSCKAPVNLTSGAKRVYVAVAGYNRSFDGLLQVECDAGYYSVEPIGVCAQCPEGAVCEQGLPPRSLPGYGSRRLRESEMNTDFVVQSQTSQLQAADAGTIAANATAAAAAAAAAAGAVPTAATQQLDNINIMFPANVIFEACTPKVACRGNDTCETGYETPQICLDPSKDVPRSECNAFGSEPEASRCSKCARGYFPLTYECHECPKQVWIWMLLYGVGLILLGGVALVLLQKGPSIGVVGVGLDYFQVLSMFSGFQLHWPTSIKTTLDTLSISNLNIELVSPECAVPDLSYSNKWIMVQSFPFLLILVGSAYVGIQRARLRCQRGCWRCYQNCCRKTAMHQKEGKQDKPRDVDIDRLINGYVMLFYFVYLYEVKMALELFSCEEKNGIQVLRAVPSERCYEGDTFVLLRPFATISIIFYSVILPICFLFIVIKNRKAVEEDQILRMQGKGYARETNPHYSFRKRYNKIYYRFKPKYFYWTNIVFARKFCLAVIAMLFTQNPTFQAAACIMTLFICYAMTTRASPYLRNDLHDEDKERMFDAAQHARGHGHREAGGGSSARNAFANAGPSKTTLRAMVNKSPKNISIQKSLAKKATSSVEGLKKIKSMPGATTSSRASSASRGRFLVGSRGQSSPKKDAVNRTEKTMSSPGPRGGKRTKTLWGRGGRGDKTLASPPPADEKPSKTAQVFKRAASEAHLAKQLGAKSKLAKFRRAANKAARAFVTDYNTMDCIFFVTSIIVLLSGVMYESGYNIKLNSFSEGPATDVADEDYVLTGFVLLVVISSTLFFSWNLLRELGASFRYYRKHGGGQCCKWCRRRMRGRIKAEPRTGGSKGGTGWRERSTRRPRAVSSPSTKVAPSKVGKPLAAPPSKSSDVEEKLNWAANPIQKGKVTEAAPAPATAPTSVPVDADATVMDDESKVFSATSLSSDKDDIEASSVAAVSMSYDSDEDETGSESEFTVTFTAPGKIARTRSRRLSTSL